MTSDMILTRKDAAMLGHSYAMCYVSRVAMDYKFTVDFRIFPTLRAFTKWSAENQRNLTKADCPNFAGFDEYPHMWKRNDQQVKNLHIGTFCGVVNIPKKFLAHEANHAMLAVCRTFHPYTLMRLAASDQESNCEEETAELVELFFELFEQEIAEAKKFFKKFSIKHENSKSNSFKIYAKRSLLS